MKAAIGEFRSWVADERLADILRKAAAEPETWQEARADPLVFLSSEGLQSPPGTVVELYELVPDNEIGENRHNLVPPLQGWLPPERAPERQAPTRSR